MQYEIQIAPNPRILIISTKKVFVSEIIEVSRVSLENGPKDLVDLAKELLENKEFYTLHFDEEGRIEIDGVEGIDWEKHIPKIKEILDAY